MVKNDSASLLKVLLIVLTLMVVSACTQQKTVMSLPPGTLIAQQLHDIRAKEDLPSLQVTLGHISKQKSLTVSSGSSNEQLYQIASLSKSYIAALILQLEEEQRLNIEDKIGLYFPELVKWQDVRIKQLLSHNSGLPPYTQTKAFWPQVKAQPEKIWQKEELIALAYQQPLAFLPGSAYQYSNTEYELLVMLIEKITAQPFAAVLQEKILQPLQITDTHYFENTIAAPIYKKMVHGFNHEGTFAYHSDVSDYRISPAVGALLSNSQATYLWLCHLFAHDFLPASQLKKMLQLYDQENGKAVSRWHKHYEHQQQHNDKTTVGSGLGINGLRLGKYGFYWSHVGANLGYESLFLVNPQQDLIMVIMTNARKKNTSALINTALALLESVYFHTESD